MASKSLAYLWKKVWVRSSDMSIGQLGVIAQEVLKRSHGKILEYPAELRFGGIEIDVRFEPPYLAHGQPGMRRVDLARMDIEDHGPAFAKHLQRHLTNQPIGKQPQVPSTEETHRLTQQVGNGDRALQQSLMPADAMRFAPPTWHPAV